MQTKTKLKAKTSLKGKATLKAKASLPSKSTGKTSKQKKPTVTKLKKKADTLWSQYIRLRDSNGKGIAECITCGVQKPIKQMQCGHFVTRACNLLRYDEENTNAQCYSCNVMNHGEQFQYAINLDLKYGDGTAQKLHKQRKTEHQFTTTELEQIISDAKTLIEHYSLT